MGSSFDYVWVPTLHAAFLTGYEGEVAGIWGTPLLHELTDTGEFVKTADLGTVGAVRQFVGPRVQTKPRVYVQTQQNLPFELSFQIDVEDVNRDKIGIWETKAREVGAKFADHPTKLMIAQILANPNCFDGTAFFGTHANGGNAIINDVSATQIPGLAASTAAAPTAVEMAVIVTQLLGYFASFVDEAGDPINGTAREFLFATSNPAVVAVLETVFTAMQLTQGQTNPIVAGWRPKGYKFDAVLDIRLGAANGTVFYMFRKDSIVKPFIWAEEQAMQMSFIGEGSEMAFLTNKYAWGGKAVRSIGTGRYQHAVRATLS
jgi:phage major head subunit gpT-like protein